MWRLEIQGYLKIALGPSVVRQIYTAVAFIFLILCVVLVDSALEVRRQRLVDESRLRQIEVRH